MALSVQVDKSTFEEIKNKGGSLTAAEFRQLINSGSINTETKTKEKKHYPKFFFTAEFEKSDDIETILVVRGRHYAKNTMDTWVLGQVIQYKKAIKEAVQLAKIKFAGKLQHYEFAEFEYNVYNPKSRDDDANFNTLKVLRDSVVLCGIIDDDKRKIVKKSTENEVISKEWKIEVKVLNCAKDCASS